MSRPDVAAVRKLLSLAEPPHQVSVRTISEESIPGGRRVRLGIACPDGDQMPALLLVPNGAHEAPGVVVFHQHASQWHLGKSEVAGLQGDPIQAFGPTLAEAGLMVLAPDAVGFEDRRRTTSGTDPHPDDRDQQERELAYRLLHGQPLAAKVLADAQTALTVLRARPEVAPDRIGVLGHSFGGNTVIFHAALDHRVAFAATSGAAGTYRTKIANEIGIDRAEVIPGVLGVFDIDDLTRLISPRPLGIFASDNDRYALDAAGVGETTRQTYLQANAVERLHVDITPGGHALTAERAQRIVDWTVKTAGPS